MCFQFLEHELNSAYNRKLLWYGLLICFLNLYLIRLPKKGEGSKFVWFLYVTWLLKNTFIDKFTHPYKIIIYYLIRVGKLLTSDEKLYDLDMILDFQRYRSWNSIVSVLLRLNYLNAYFRGFENITKSKKCALDPSLVDLYFLEFGSDAVCNRSNYRKYLQSYGCWIVCVLSQRARSRVIRHLSQGFRYDETVSLIRRTS